MIIPAKSIILASIGKPISDTAEGKKNGEGALMIFQMLTGRDGNIVVKNSIDGEGTIF